MSDPIQHLYRASDEAGAAPRRKGTSSVTIALMIALLVGAWVFSGVIFGNAEVQPVITEPKTYVQKVRIRRQVATPHIRTVSIYGVTEAARKVQLKPETTSNVTEILVDEGSTVSAGEVLLRLDPRDRKERVKEAEASVAQRKIDFKIAQSLSKQGFESEARLARAAAELAAAERSLKEAQLELKRTEIRAPFDGVVDLVRIEEGDLVGPNIFTSSDRGNSASNESSQAVVTLIDPDPLVITGQVSERVVNHIQLGATGTANLVTGEAVEGVVRYLSAIADPLTRTFRVELEVPNGEGVIAEGVTAEIVVPLGVEKAHFVPSSILSLNQEGVIGVKTLTPDASVAPTSTGEIKGAVRFYPAEIFDDTTQGVWLTELPETVYFITLGQAFVNPGDVVVGSPESVL